MTRCSPGRLVRKDEVQSDPTKAPDPIISAHYSFPSVLTASCLRLRVTRDERLLPSIALPESAKASPGTAKRTLPIAIPFLAKSSPGWYDERQVWIVSVPRTGLSVGKRDLIRVERAFSFSPSYFAGALQP